MGCYLSSSTLTGLASPVNSGIPFSRWFPPSPTRFSARIYVRRAGFCLLPVSAADPLPLVAVTRVGICALRGFLGRDDLLLVSSDGKLVAQISHPQIRRATWLSSSGTALSGTRIGRLHPPQHLEFGEPFAQCLHASFRRRAYAVSELRMTNYSRLDGF